MEYPGQVRVVVIRESQLWMLLAIYGSHHPNRFCRAPWEVSAQFVSRNFGAGTFVYA